VNRDHEADQVKKTSAATAMRRNGINTQK